MICVNCGTYCRSTIWNSTRFCNNCYQYDGELSDLAPADEDLSDEISRLQEDHGTSKTKPVFYNDWKIIYTAYAKFVV